MNNTSTTHDTRPIGSLPRRFPPRFARLMREIRKADPALAAAIRREIVAAQTAERRVRSLLARYRITCRRVPVLHFLAAAKRA